MQKSAHVVHVETGRMPKSFLSVWFQPHHSHKMCN